jgi:hypothetical protein
MIYTLDQYQLCAMLGAIAKNSPSMEKDAEKLIAILKNASDQSIVSMPDFHAHGFDIEDVKGWILPHQQEWCEALFRLSDRRCRVRHEAHKRVALNYEDTLPPDIAPLVVCDASGRSRKMYEWWYRDRGGLAFLPSPRKDFSGLTLHVANMAAGRDKFKPKSKDASIRIEAIAKTIEADIPRGERVLIVHFKPSGQLIDVAAAVQDQCPDHYIGSCSWGQHTATNEFADCKYSISAGVLQKPSSTDEAIARAAMERATHEAVGDHVLKEIRIGEIAHNVYQAICRGNVRKSEGAGCPFGNHAYVMASQHATKGIPKDLWKDLFPGARILDWEPLPLTLTGQVAELAKIIEREQTSSPDGTIGISKKKLMKELEIAYQQNVNRLFKHPDLAAWCDVRGYCIKPKRGCFVVTPASATKDKVELDGPTTGQIFIE